jgi:hypothetical protein
MCPRFPPTVPDGGGALAGDEVRRGEANKGAGKCDYPYPRSFGGGGSAGEVSGGGAEAARPRRLGRR